MFLECDPDRQYPELLVKMPFVYVSAGVIIDQSDKMLIAKRTAEQSMAGLWEFPGGKIQEDEIPEIALVRELQEELSIKTSPGCFYPLTFISHRYTDFHLIMYVFVCRKYSGIARGLQGQELKWISPRDLVKYDMAKANLPLISAVRDL